MLMPERFRDPARRTPRALPQQCARPPHGARGSTLFGRRRDGTEFPVEISLSPIEDGGRTLVAAAIRDVTDRKRLEAELILAREAAEAARTLADEARELADRANQGKSRFLATASHDLRQPLQTLGLLNGTLRRRATDHHVDRSSVATGAGHWCHVAAAQCIARHQQARVWSGQTGADRFHGGGDFRRAAPGIREYCGQQGSASWRSKPARTPCTAIPRW